MSEWQVTKVGLEASYINRGVSPKYTEDIKLGITVINQKCIRNGHIDLGLSRLHDKSKSAHPDKFLQNGDILINSTGVGTAGRVGIFDKHVEAFVDSHVTIVRPNKALIHPEYLFHSLRYREDEIEGYAEGSTGQIELGRDKVKDIDISKPSSIDEQKAIASVLSSLDDKIDLLHRQNTTLERMAETLFRQWFVEEAQEDWEKKPLGDLLTITSSKRVFYSEYVSIGIPFYRSKEIIELHNSGSTNSELYISEARFNEITQQFGAPKEGDILLTSVGTLGIPYRVKKTDKFYFKDGNLTWFKDFDRLPSVVIYCWLKSSIGKEQLDGITIGSTQSALTISGMKQITLQVPPKDIIKNLKDKLTSIYNKIDANQKQIQSLEKLRDNLLPKLMSGEVRVTLNGEHHDAI